MCTTVVDTDSATNYSWDGFFFFFFAKPIWHSIALVIASVQLQTVDVSMENPPMEQIYDIQTLVWLWAQRIGGNVHFTWLY